MKFENDFQMNFDNMENSCQEMPVCECPEERVCHRYIMHEVPHIKPVQTKIINHHMFKHTYTPVYSCVEENVCENVCSK